LRTAALDPHLGGAAFKSRPGHQLHSYLLWFSSVPVRKFRDNTSIRSPPYPSKSLPINYSSVVHSFTSYSLTTDRGAPAQSV
jgi:hypothetical protein